MTAPKVEAEARRYLRLFPNWMRADRGEEAVGLVLDQLPPGAPRLPLRSKIDLVRAGLHARHRATPPYRVWDTASTTIGNRGRQLPVAWHPWLIAKLQRRSFAWQVAFLRDPVFLFPLLLTSLSWYGDPSVPDVLFAFLAFLVVVSIHAAWFLVVTQGTWRARLLSANGLDADGRPLPSDEVVTGWTKATIPDARVAPFALGCTAASAVVGPLAWAGLVGTLADPEPVRPFAWSAGLVVVTVLLAASWALRRVRLRSMAPGSGASGAFGATAGIGAAAGLITAGFVGMLGTMANLDPAAALALPLGSLVILLVVVGAEQLQGRRIGAWDVVPAWGPELIVHRTQDLPPPPPPVSPDTPAFG